MRRRSFLVGVIVGPAWLQLAFADASIKGGDTALERAQSSVQGEARAFRDRIPSDDGAKEVLGNVFGLYLNEGSDVQLAPLAHVDVVCAAVPGDPPLLLMLLAVNTSGESCVNLV